jgi:hypothetical protein
MPRINEIVRIGSLLLPFFATACVGESVAYHSADVCSASGHGIIGAWMASDALHECKEAYLKAGYIEGPGAPPSAETAPAK